MRRPINPRSASTRLAMSCIITSPLRHPAPSFPRTRESREPGVSTVALDPRFRGGDVNGNISPAVTSHQLGPAAVELPMIAFAKAGIAGPGAERRIEALVPEPHLIVYRQTPRGNATTGLGAFLPVVHVVLLKGAGRAEAANAGEAERLLDDGGPGLVDKHIRPDFGLVGAARLPHPERARGAAQQREIRKDCADDRVDQARAWA